MVEKSHHLKASLVDHLLERCLFYSGRTDCNQTAALQEFEELTSLIIKIGSLEKGMFREPKREDNLDVFIKWCEARGIKIDSIGIRKIDEDSNEYGLFATEIIPENELILSIPDQAVFCVESLQDSGFLDKLQNDPMLKSMPNLMLAFLLMIEYCKPDSGWKPYFNFFPADYSTPLYYSTRDMEMLKGSPTLHDAVKLCRNIFRQYAYFWKKFHSKASPEFNKLPLKKNFCFNLYRWAVSSVMTRQNVLPSPQPKTALIPMWDMCNHENGKFSTDYDPQGKEVLFYAMKTFKKDQEIKIFYGERTNSEFLLNNGFVPSDSIRNSLNLRLGFTKSDPLLSSRVKIAEAIEVPISGNFPLFNQKEGYDTNLVKFLRVFTMSREEVENCIESIINNKINRSDFERVNDNVKNFLKTRSQILLRGYAQEVSENDLSNIGKRIKFFIQQEKKILESFVD
ncbi:SET domain containing 3 [Brevipalpus obovatus]|uniref:SET domain containing 3 n=1 Tax=Brevipalpus obovatus TaxID=246614 RepID=UPI003D9DF102